MKLYLLLISLLIFSCDLPNEADADCSGINMGSAFIDECGRCVGENTGFTAGYDKDVCGECFGENDCARCNEIDAINYVDIDGTNFLPDNDMCVYDLCETIPSNVESSCNSSQASPKSLLFSNSVNLLSPSISASKPKPYKKAVSPAVSKEES